MIDSTLIQEIHKRIKDSWTYGSPVSTVQWDAHDGTRKTIDSELSWRFADGPFALIDILNDGQSDMVYTFEWTGVGWIAKLGDSLYVKGAILPEAICRLFVAVRPEVNHAT